MDELNNDIQVLKSPDLTEKECYQIEALFKIKCSINDIALNLNRSVRTIQREIARGTVILKDTELREIKVYSAYHSVTKRIFKRSKCGRKPKSERPNVFMRHVAILLKHKYSPDAIIGETKLKGLFPESIICTKTLYNYIYKGYFSDILPNKYPKKVKKHKRAVSYLKPLKASIDERPVSADNREFGHWEIDCVCSGKGSPTALLVITDRQSRYNIIRKLKNKSNECVANALDSIERVIKRKYKCEFKDIFLSITADNGCEFLNFQRLEKSTFSEEKRTKLYYANPYSSWQRGSNENANKLIRKHIKKGEDINNYSNKQIYYIQQWVNYYPRKLLNYLNACNFAKYVI